MSGTSVWAGLLPICGAAAAWVAFRGPVLRTWRARDVVRARALFRRGREHLEAHFLDALARVEPIERLRWEQAAWLDEVVWARDRRTHRLLALVGVRFECDPLSGFPEQPPRYATALFEFRNGRWLAEGKHFAEILPDEAFLHLTRFVPVEPPQRQA